LRLLCALCGFGVCLPQRTRRTRKETAKKCTFNPGNWISIERIAVGDGKPNSVYNQSMRILNFTVVMTPDVTGGYVVTCPALPGLVTEGDTLEEARAMATDAIHGYLESLKKDGQPIPTDGSITPILGSVA
jgi:antitoxin HicB